jgi:hypothetical protein
MDLTVDGGLDQIAVSNVITDLISIPEQNVLDYSQYKEVPKLVISQMPLVQVKKHRIYLSVTAIRKMVLRFLTEKKMSKEKLAKGLAVKVVDLERIFTPDDLSRSIPKINLPLIKLYCATKWIK